MEKKTIVEHWPGGNIKRLKILSEDGKYHNPNGPAIQSWYKNGREEWRSYWVDGKRHNPHGPAVQAWYKNGREEYREYWLNGETLSREEWEARRDKVKIEVNGETKWISRESAEELNLV